MSATPSYGATELEVALVPAEAINIESLVADETESRKGNLGKIADLLERNGIDVADIGRVNRVNIWQGFYKDADGEAHTVDQFGVQLSPSWEEGPKWPVVEQGKQVIVKGPKAKPLPKLGDSWKTVVVLPDIQVGFYTDRNGKLHPTHDEAAIDVALQVVAAEDPDIVVIIGDAADFPEFGKYRLSPAFQRTTQPTIDYLTELSARIRFAAPNARIIWLAGNHEERLPNYILDNAAAAFGIRRGDKTDKWPVMSVPFLCRFDEYDIEFLSGYPANEFYVNDRLKIIHGMKVNSSGSTVHKYLDSERVSTISGHVHRREIGHRTRRTREGARTIMAASPGCLARIDGKVPSTKGGTDLDGVPLESYEDWQQGLAVVRYEEGDGRFVYSDIGIFDGYAQWRDKEFYASTDESI